MNKEQKIKIIINALIAVVSLLIVYFVIVTAVSGFKFALSQFSSYWYFLVSLATGFGIQIGLYSYLKQLVKTAGAAMGGKTVAVTGTTSTLSMISCCAHYLANIVPILGIAGALSIIAQYQIEIFWVGLAFNIFGIAFIINKIIKFKKHL
jgi:Cu+-exporting ATPase